METQEGQVLVSCVIFISHCFTSHPLILSAVKEFSNPVSEIGEAPSARSISGRMLPLDHLGDHKASPPHSRGATEYSVQDIQHTSMLKF